MSEQHQTALNRDERRYFTQGMSMVVRLFQVRALFDPKTLKEKENA
ncbi:hypothetical protein [Flagellimonas meridianipacifica]|nr:hypothetical protein [Allomuricauda pacifica]